MGTAVDGANETISKAWDYLVIALTNPLPTRGATLKKTSSSGHPEYEANET